MEKLKLTAAQQRVFDWLGESADHKLMICDQIIVTSHHAPEHTEDDLLDIMLSESLHIDVNGDYIHPKFAGGSDD